MKLISSYFKGFKPLALGAIDDISINFTNDIQLILGRNGCGKSNLLREHTLFPALHSNYNENGVKRVKAEDNGNIYETISYLGKVNKHTLIKNGEIILNEVNPTVLREKIIEEFNYTPLIHKLLIGDIKFTTMSSTVKRDMLQLISPLNLDYVLQLYSNVKEKLKETQIIINHLSTKLSDDQTKLIKLNIPDNINEEQERLNDQIRKLLPFTINSLPSANEVVSKLTEIKNHFESIPKAFKQADDVEMGYLVCKSHEELSEYIGHVSSQIETSHSSIIDISEKVNKLNSVIDNLTNTNLSPEEIKVKIEQLENNLLLINGKELHYEHNLNKLRSFLECLDNITIEFETIYSLIAGIKLRTVEEMTEISKAEDEVNYRLGMKSSELNRQLEHFKHLQKEEIICANCKVALTSSGMSKEEQIKTATDKISNLETSIKELETLKKDLDEQMREISIQREVTFKLESLRRRNELPLAFWFDLQNPTYTLSNKLIVFSTINNWISSVKESILYLEIKAELTKYKTALDSYNLLGGDSETKVIEYNQQLTSLIEKKQVLEGQLKHARLYLKKANYFRDGLVSITEKTKEYDKYLGIYVDVLIQEDAKLRQNSIHGELGKLNHRINQREILLNQISSLQKDLVEYKSSLEALVLLEKNLSHNKGIIAEQMNRFMITFVDEMNNIINNIWEYSMEVLPCPMDKGTLSYVFPFKVEDSLIPDTNFASTSQADIINLAFVMVVRQYLDLVDFPLYMDETGSGFDEAHRECLLNYIKDVVNNNLCSQLFIINHYSHVYGGLSNHSAIVLNPTGITVPEHYNEEVVITYL